MKMYEYGDRSKPHMLLADLFGKERGDAYCDCARRQAQIWLQTTSETSPTRLKMMRETILPRVAVYAVLKDNGKDADTALSRYVRKIIGPRMHKIYAGAEKTPFFYGIFSRAIVHITEKSGLWDCASKREKDRFTLNIHKCLWHETCMACGYPVTEKSYNDWELADHHNKKERGI